MNSPDSLTPEQKEALAALESQTGEWGALAKALGKTQAGPIPSLSAGAIARLEAVRTEALASVHRAPVPRRVIFNRALFYRMAAVLALLAAISWFLIPHRSSNAEIVIASPRGDTTSNHPTIDWQAKPGKNYDVWILPSEGDVLTAPALFKAEKVRPPLEFAALKPGKNTPPGGVLSPGSDYRVLVCYADTHRIGGIAVAFHVKPFLHSP